MRHFPFTLKIFSVFFLYTLFLLVVIHAFLLSCAFKSWNLGDGVSSATPDTQRFHRIAVALSERIHREGWSAWRLRPEEQAPAGIAAAIYAVTVPKVWVMLPFNAALHALAALVLFLLVDVFLRAPPRSLLCVLPFLLFPSSLQFSAQLHKDSYSVLGIILVLYGFVSFSSDSGPVRGALRRFVVPVASGIFGLFLIWIVRPYLVRILFYTGMLSCAVLCVKYSLSIVRRNGPGEHYAKLFLAVVFMAIFAQYGKKLVSTIDVPAEMIAEGFTAVKKTEASLNTVVQKVNTPLPPVLPVEDIPKSVGVAENTPAVASVPRENPVITLPKLPVEKMPQLPVAESRILPLETSAQDVPAPEEVAADIPVSAIPVPVISAPEIDVSGILIPVLSHVVPSVAIESWRYTPGVPAFIEEHAFTIALRRSGFLVASRGAGSNIDDTVVFRSLTSELAYVFRALQIALLAPFPAQWFSRGGTDVASFMRRTSSFEMMVVYFLLAFLPYALWKWRRRVETWILLIFCAFPMIVLGLVICNVGTLYRMRYGYLMTLVALAAAGFLAAVERLRKKEKG